MSLGSNGVERVRSLRKIPMPLLGTNFCTSLARFASSFVSHLNGPKCTKILWNAPKHFLGAMGWIGCVRCQKFRRDFEARTFAPLRPFCTEFCNSTKRSQMHQNCTKCTKTWVYGPMGWNGCVRCEKFRQRFVGRTFAPFWPVFIEFCKSTKWSQMHQNFMKCSKTFFQGPMGWIGCIRYEKSRRNFEARTFAPLRPFCTEFSNSTKRSPMHQNCTKHTETWV